jgi:hypothetical protein
LCPIPHDKRKPFYTSFEKYRELNLGTFAMKHRLFNFKNWAISSIGKMNKNTLIFIIALVINLFLVAPRLMPAFGEINGDDEAKYVVSGHLLLEGYPRDLAWGPLLAVFYAPIHLLVGNSPDWFMLETWIGRFILYIFLWISIYYLALQFKEQAPPLIMVGMLFVVSAFIPIVENQSDALFVSLSALGLSKFIAYYRKGNLKDLGFASVCVGLGILCRVETIVLIGVITILAIIYRRHAIIKAIAVALLPALIPLALFFTFSLLTVRSWNLGVGDKSYDSFEMNQPIQSGGITQDPRHEARILFGTKAENNGSVLRAIVRNPPAFLSRILSSLKTVPLSFLTFFGKRVAPFLAFFALWGVYTLIKRRKIALLIIPLIWALHVVIALAFFTKHIVPQAIYIPLLLAGIGMASAFENDLHPWERIVFLVASILFGLFSWVTNKPAFIGAFIFISAIFIIIQLFWFQLNSNKSLLQTSLLLLLAAGLILREPYTFLYIPDIGKSIDEQAVHYLQQSFPKNTLVLTPFSLPALAAKMNNVDFDAVPPEIKTVDEFWLWLNQNDIRVVYVNKRYMPQSEIPNLIEAGLGQDFTIGYVTENNLSTVYRVMPISAP